MNIMDFIYFLGEHFASVVVGCIELLVGVFFLVHYFSINRGKRKSVNCRAFTEWTKSFSMR